MWQSGQDADAIIEEQGLKQVTDTGAIEKIVDEVIAANPGQVEEYRGGKDKLIGFFVGQVMQKSKGKANPGMVNELLKKKLKK
jgi:aspartyl-tRNA(Asn)/glutamyl-tRNA(Gln) amidotransferase subunit B